MKSKHILLVFPLLLGIVAIMSLPSCTRQPTTPEGRTYWYQCHWDSVAADLSPYGDFNKGGILVHHDDTATIQGTWSNVNETVVWQLNNPPKNTKFRGTYDKNWIAGNVSDDLGRKGTINGARR